MRKALFLLVLFSICANGCGEQAVHQVPTVVHIDTVPQGAKVYARSDNVEKGEVFLGETPLAVSPDKCPSVTFSIVMEMDYYISKVRDLEGMPSWLRDFAALRPPLGTVRPLDYFPFEVDTSTVAQDPSGKIVTMGPVMTLDWPNKNRLCVWFIPRHVNPESFYPIMPPTGTFPIEKEGFGRSLQQQGLGETQAALAVECVSRCGKYVGENKAADRASRVRSFVVTSQKEPLEDLITLEVYEEDAVGG